MSRYSVREDDQGHANFKRYGRDGFKSITVDGVDILDRCIMADEEAGEVLVHIRNDAGEFFVNEEGKDTAQEVLKGKVIVNLKCDE